jgi:hypothetical protein
MKKRSGIACNGLWRATKGTFGVLHLYFSALVAALMPDPLPLHRGSAIRRAQII